MSKSDYVNMYFKRQIVLIVCVMAVGLSFARELRFHAIGKAEGLSDMFVLHITQLRNGDIAVTSGRHVDIINGDKVKSYSKELSQAMPLKGYKGAYHAYVDKRGWLWVKDYQRVWCYDQDMKPQYACIPDSCDDLFVDEQGKVHFIKQQSDAVLDIVTMKGLEYEFHNNGVMTCRDAEHRKLYDIAVPLDSAAITSLTVSDTIQNRFYQLIDGRLCIEYDLNSRKWTEVFRSEQLYTISLVNSKTAYIVSKNGLWKINLQSRKVEMVEQVRMDDGSYISSSRINSVFADRDGNVWFGTFDHGVLRASPGNGNAIYWIVSAIALLAMGCIGWMMLRKRNGATSKLEGYEKKTFGNELAVNPVVDNEFVERVRQTIEQNITSSSYSVEKLAQDMCMERTGLYKKLVAMTGATPTAFIRRIKVERAISLIQSGNYTMAQVAELTGFSSSSYMAKCFQEEKGIKPSEIKDFNDSTVLNQQ